MSKGNIISWDEFTKIDVRSGTIVKAEDFPRAKKPAYKVWVDFGPDIGIKQTSAQITKNYKTGDLIGRQIAACVNLGEKNIAGFMSQFLLLGFTDANGDIAIINIDPKVPNGEKMH